MSKIKSIPNNWKLLEFGEFAERKSNKHNPKTADTGMRCLELEHFEQGTGKIIGFVDSLNQASIKNVFGKGEVLFGKLRPYLKKYWFTEFEGVCSSEVWVLTGKKNTHNKYLFYLVQQHKFIETCNKTTGSKMPRADWKTVEVEPFLLPPLPEQQKIASILSKWDELIETQTQLIEEKEKQKKGLMQKLLTGEVRFPGFEEEWEEVKLGSDFEIVGGGTPSTSVQEYWEDDILWFTPTEIKSKYINSSIRKISHLGLQKSSASLLPKGTLLFTSRATIGQVGIALQECSTNQGFQSFLPNERSSIEYLYYWVLNNKKTFIMRSSGSTFIEISKKEIAKIKWYRPRLKEQIKIASALSSIDEEIQSLKDELEAIKLQKKGLMQQLLTGRIRVKIK